ncbi:MAG: hypothetical protein GX853_08820 [Chloroflexi bacterium]|jgi:hypothetical protein|nr:hypothetical protein [Chloroflexota bacterium]
MRQIYLQKQFYQLARKRIPNPSEDIANAMDLRGFGQRKRTWLYELIFHWWDWALIVFSVVMLATVLILAFRFDMRLFSVPQWWYGLFAK